MWLCIRPSAIRRDEILTELGLPLNFFMPIAGTEFNGDFPEDLNETFKAVTYSSDVFNIEWFFERGNLQGWAKTWAKGCEKPAPAA